MADHGNPAAAAVVPQQKTLSFDMDGVLLECAITPPLLDPGTAPQIDRPIGTRRFVECAMNIARRIPLLNSMITHASTLPLTSQDLYKGKLIIPLTDVSACHPLIIYTIIDWVDYHQTDDNYRVALALHQFIDDDFYDAYQYKLDQLPCHFDITMFGKLNNNAPLGASRDGRAYFYDLLTAAHFLQLDELVLSGGKWLRLQLQSCADVQAIGQILGTVTPPMVAQPGRGQRHDA